MKGVGVVLIRFSVQNFMSFKNGVSLSMECAPISEHEETHTFAVDNYHFLKSVVIYGANASGKSNLLLALHFMRDFILNSSKESNATEEIDVAPYRLSTVTENQPSIFEIEFLRNERVYRYGFSVDLTEIHEEWLYYFPYKERKKEVQLFSRNKNKIIVPKGTPFSREGKGLEEKTRHNALFLSVAANFNGKISGEVQRWMEECDFISGMSNNSIGFTAKMLKDPKVKNKIVKLMQAADIGIEDIIVEEIELKNTKLAKHLPKEIIDDISSAEMLLSKHKKYNEDDEEVGMETFNLGEVESEGTKKFLALVGPILDKLEKGGLLIVDELDAKMHPLLTRNVVSLFNSYDLNRADAQIIYATHDVTNLTNKIFRRDQLWFVQKDSLGSSELYSLADYRDDEDKKIRKDATFAKDYILGKYGAIPKFRSWKRAMEENNGDA